LQNILIFYIGIKLEVASNSTPMVDFAIAINRILTHPCILLRGWFFVPVGGTRMGQKMNLKIFKKLWWKYSQYTLSILNTQSHRNFIHWLSHGPERVNLNKCLTSIRQNNNKWNKRANISKKNIQCISSINHRYELYSLNRISNKKILKKNKLL